MFRFAWSTRCFRKRKKQSGEIDFIKTTGRKKQLQKEVSFQIGERKSGEKSAGLKFRQRARIQNGRTSRTLGEKKRAQCQESDHFHFPEK